MKTLLDENINKRVKALLTGIEVFTVREMGWLGVENGELQKKMSTEGFMALITGDKNMPFQQNLSALLSTMILIDAPDSVIETQRLFFPKIQAFLTAPPATLPKIAHISVEGVTKGNLPEKLQQLLPPEDLLFL